MKSSKYVFLIVFLLSVTFSLKAQKQIIQLSGLTVAGDSLYGIQGVHIINKNSKVGYVSSEKGYFSFPVKAQDTILFSFVGFKKEYLVILSNCPENKFTIILDMKIDTTQLDLIEVLPYPTVELFKEAFVRLELPEDKLKKNIDRNLDERILRKIFTNMDMTASMNYTNYTQDQIRRFEQPGFVATSQILNPFAWIQLIKAIKNGEFKRKEDE